MKKVYKIIIDCANCAAKVERAIAKIDGVIAVSVNFMAGKLTLECEDGKADSIYQQMLKAAKRIEPDCEIR